MAALTTDRNTRGLHPVGYELEFPVAASTTIYKGALVALNATGYLVPVTATTGLKAVGCAQQDADNSAGADGALDVIVSQGTFLWNNATGGDAITIADVGLPAYGDDDQTVTDTATGRSRVGVIAKVDDGGGIWVDTQPGTIS